GQVVVHWTYDSSVVQFLTYHRVPLTPIDHPELPFDFQAQRDVVLIFEVGEWSDYLPEMHRLYPGAEWSTLSTPWKQPFLWVVRIPKDELDKARGSRKPGVVLPTGFPS
ncbi:MAG TPA: hypothetical protein VFR02_05600, partial [bacterium]|nr:hypothetical protein [bacterium]